MKENTIDQILGRSESLFKSDFEKISEIKKDELQKSTFVVVGGAGSIGSSVVKLLVKLKAKKIQVIDISENNLVELIRDIRSSDQEIVSELETYSLDCNSQEFIKYFNDQKSIDYLLNFSAMKHVRSERNIYTLKRLIDVNIIYSINLLKMAAEKGCKKYFCVSTDKAANPVNMMGASKQIMERLILSHNFKLNVSTARFANVAFSDGSLLFGFEHRLQKKQPLAVPTDIRRFFVSPEEAGQLCLISCLAANDKEIFFPKIGPQFNDISLLDITGRYLKMKGLELISFPDELSAKQSIDTFIEKGAWPCYLFKSNTTGEKEYEEFYTDHENISMETFDSIGVVNFDENSSFMKPDEFLLKYQDFLNSSKWSKSKLVKLFQSFLPDFHHEELGRNLDQKM